MSDAELIAREQAEKDSVELADYLHRAVGYTLTGSVQEQVMFVMHGNGSNGKSLFISMLMRLFGALSKRASQKLFMLSKSGSDHPTELTDLLGKRFVAAVETAEGQQLNEAFIKEAAGGDRIVARRMNENFWEFEPTHKLWLATNHRPKIRDTSHGMWRKVHLIPFDVRFQKPDADDFDESMPIADLDLESKLADELPGILAWAVRGCQEWITHGLKPPRIVQDATKEYREEQDSLGQFIAETCMTGPNYTAVFTQLWGAYKLWGEGGNEYIGSQTAFGRKLKERGYEKQKTNSKVIYLGIGLSQ